MTGTVALEDRQWVITCQPHVMTRFKRVFAGVRKSSHGSVRLSATPQNSRDLEWFLARYPMKVLEADVLARLSSEDKEREAETVRILAGAGSRTPPAPLAIPARDYQQQVADLVCTNGFLLLADDLGTGKTVSALATLVQHGRWPALVVTLTHLPTQWQRELARFCPSLTAHILNSTTPYDVEADVLICNYHKLSGWADTLSGMVKAVVFDEIQELRRSQSAKYSAAAHIAERAELRLGLSGTPIYNYGGEIFNVINVLSPGALGEFEEFDREWCVGFTDKRRLKDPKAFGLYARSAGFMLRRTRKDVGREIPPLSVFPHEVETDKRQLAEVEKGLEGLARTILSSEQLVKGAKFRAAGELDYRLRRDTGMLKAPYTATFVRMLVEAGESVLLYGWHHDVYDVWRTALGDLKPAFYTGRETPAAKEREIKRFIAGDTPVAILSLRAGAGLDGLQHVCRTVVFGELDWSPGVHEQGLGRVYRDGQVDPVFAYFLIADGGSDPIVADVLGVKRGQIDGLKDPDAPLAERRADPGHISRLAQACLERCAK